MGRTWVVPLSTVPLDPAVTEAKRRYEDEFGKEPTNRGGWYHRHDWPRISYALGRLGRGDRFLDVGVGAGQFVNAVAMSGRFVSVTGSDIHRFKKYRDFDGEIASVRAPITDFPFPDDHFDTVTCMEVLEHVSVDEFEAGLKELRRICGGRLIMTVPFEEPEPIYDGHQRRFTKADLAETFPEAELTLLLRTITPWVVAEEWHGPLPRPHHQPPETGRLLDGRAAALAWRLSPHIGRVAASARRRLRR